jgi:polyhydroxybutyrate depolymerase
MRRVAVLLATTSVIVSACGAGVLPPRKTASGTSSLGEPGRHQIEVQSAGMRRSAVVHVPDSLPDPAPLVIVFHGFTGNPAGVARLTGMHEVGEREGFITVYPAARGLIPAWRADRGASDDADVVFVRDLVASIASALPVDLDRVYAAGMSNGGGMVDRLACEADDLIAAAAPVAGAFSGGGCDPARPVPIVAIHGTGDWIVPFYGFPGLLPSVPAWNAAWAERNECRGPAAPRSVAADVAEYSWESCGAEVVLYVVDGGGHDWPGGGDAGGPGGGVSASEIIWEFFAGQA